MKSLTTARRYARALYQLAEEHKVTSDVLQGMSNIALALTTTPTLEKILTNPLIKPEEKQNFIQKITSNKLILKFIYLLAKRDRMNLLVLIYDELRSLSDAAQGLHRVLVKTPMVLSDVQKKQIEKDLARSVGGSVTGTFEIAKDLIGGMWVKMGDKVLDASLKGAIEDLRHTLVHSTN